MPSSHPFVVTLRGTEEYSRYLARLRKALGKAGVALENDHQLADYALAVLGAQHGLRAPRRMPPAGGARPKGRLSAKPE